MTKIMDQLSLNAEKKVKVDIVLLTILNGKLKPSLLISVYTYFFMFIDTFNYAEML